jgi:AcrR family transcriptional regulator
MSATAAKKAKVAQNRYEKRRQRTRDAIIQAAAATFLRKGVAGTTVAEITEAADVGYGSFYNHFHSLQDLVSAVADRTMARVVSVTEELLPEEDGPELVPAVSLRIIMRLMTHDPSTRWLLEQPYIFVDEWQKVITPSMAQYREKGGPEPFAVMGGLQTWMRMLPWLLISELNDSIEKGSSTEHEEILANMSLHLLGLDAERRRELVEASREIVDAAELSCGAPD